MKTGLCLRTALISVLILMAGCSTPSAFDEQGLPRSRYLVGGGMEIEYVAPKDGTAYWVEETTARILSTRSLAAGDPMEVMGVDYEWLQTTLGIAVSDARFTLYFVPAKGGQE